MFNVKKSDTPAADFLYSDPHIVALIKNDFFDKCYLCEEKTPRHLEVEHFYPQAYFPTLIHDWHNLICICEKCNKIRPKKINTDDTNSVLNPCIDDVEKLIQLNYNQADYSVSITSAETIPDVENTLRLLYRIHNGGGQTSSTSYIDLRKLIAEEIAALEEDISNLNTVIEYVFKKRIAKKLSRQSAFFAIKKSFIKENNPELLYLLAE